MTDDDDDGFFLAYEDFGESFRIHSPPMLPPPPLFEVEIDSHTAIPFFRHRLSQQWLSQLR